MKEINLENILDEKGIKIFGNLNFTLNIDRYFSNCVDGLIKIEIEKIKERKKERYIYPHKNKELV